MQAVEALQQFFKDKSDEPAYFATLDVNANAKVMQGVVLQAKKLGKSIYIFSADVAGGKVAHVNAVSEEAKAKGLDGREWASTVVAILGGKVSVPREFCSTYRLGRSTHLRISLLIQAGGKPDGAQGVGVEVSKVQEALEAAKHFFATKTSA